MSQEAGVKQDAQKTSTADEKLEIVLKRLKTEKVRCLDVETSGLDWRRHHIVGYVLTFGPEPRDSYYVPFRHRPGGNVGGRRGPQTEDGWDGKLAKGEAALIQAIDRQGVTNFGHHLNFDLRFLMRVDGTCVNSRWEDTYINEPLIDEWAGKFSLEACAARRGVQGKKGKQLYEYLFKCFGALGCPQDQKAMGYYWRLAGDDPLGVEYAEGDGTSTWQLRDKQLIEIRKPGEYQGRAEPSLELVWDVESRLIPILARMSYRGIRVDEEYLEEMLSGKTGVQAQIDQLLEQFPQDFNAKSPNDVQKWMQDHGQIDWPFTPGRIDPKTKLRIPQPSFPEAWLKKSESGLQVVRIRKLTTLRDSFFLPLRDTHLWRGRVHTTFNQLRGDEFGTVTGRLSSNEPNLQAAPKHVEEISRIYRRAFLPDEGKSWGEDDYSQMEPRLLAYYTRGKVLLEGYRANPPIDAHTSMSIAANKNWYNLSKAEQKAYRGDRGKRINQTVVTGGGKGVLVSKYEVPADEVDKVWDDYHRAFPELKPFQRSAAARMRSRGYMLTLLFRRCRLNNPDKDYVALNRLLQGGNADCLKLKMVEADEYIQRQGGDGSGLEMLLNCHDACSFQFDEAARPVYDRVLEIMCDFGSSQVIHLDVPIVMDHGEGRNWCEATWGKDK